MRGTCGGRGGRANVRVRHKERKGSKDKERGRGRERESESESEETPTWKYSISLAKNGQFRAKPRFFSSRTCLREREKGFNSDLLWAWCS